jgi:hypothetical protein
MSAVASHAAGHVLMIRPADFRSNPETLASNAFQSNSTVEPAAGKQTAVGECERLAAALDEAGVRVHLYDDSAVPSKPDAVFPNNWISFHRDGTVVLYPMLSRKRRLERRIDLLLDLVAGRGFQVRRFVDLSHHELRGRFLEGTGSLVLDRIHRIAYACRSPRTDPDVAREFAEELGYELVMFAARDATGTAIYHTNVLMALGTRFAVVCFEVIDPAARGAIEDRLRASGRHLITLTQGQMQAFAGNLIELATRDGNLVVAMSATAHQALNTEQRSVIETLSGQIVRTPVPTIETLGGGSVRCMIAEVFLPASP